MNPSHQATSRFYPEVLAYLREREAEFGLIGSERRDELQRLGRYLREQLPSDTPIRLTFICTHNSRRSHLSQIWAQLAAAYGELDGIETFSGGTETTAFNPRAVAALKRAGLRIAAEDPAAANPIYVVDAGPGINQQRCFSKVYDQSPNPKSGYVAVMTCAEADAACPVVMTAALRVPLRYEDPKVADDTPQEAARYDERSRQICREMLYLMQEAARS